MKIRKFVVVWVCSAAALCSCDGGRSIEATQTSARSGAEEDPYAEARALFVRQQAIRTQAEQQ